MPLTLKVWSDNPVVKIRRAGIWRKNSSKSIQTMWWESLSLTTINSWRQVEMLCESRVLNLRKSLHRLAKQKTTTTTQKGFYFDGPSTETQFNRNVLNTSELNKVWAANKAQKQPESRADEWLQSTWMKPHPQTCGYIHHVRYILLYSVSPTPKDRSEEVRADTLVDGWMSRVFMGDREPKRWKHFSITPRLRAISAQVLTVVFNTAVGKLA